MTLKELRETQKEQRQPSCMAQWLILTFAIYGATLFLVDVLKILGVR
jgi:hypothetical protein